MTVPTLTYYPGGLNKRIRWATANFDEREKSSFKKIKTYATDIEQATKIAKNELKKYTNRQWSIFTFRVWKDYVYRRRRK